MLHSHDFQFGEFFLLLLPACRSRSCDDHYHLNQRQTWSGAHMYVIRASNGRTATIVQGGASADLLMAIGNSYTRYFATIDLRVPNVS